MVGLSNAFVVLYLDYAKFLPWENVADFLPSVTSMPIIDNDPNIEAGLHVPGYVMRTS